MTENTHHFGMVALLGPPNAGKSTLLNHILGQKVAIVSPKPQTTRNQISGILTRDDAQVVFLDTPGVQRLSGKLPGAMSRMLAGAAWGALAQADVLALILDAAAYTAKPGLFDSDISHLAKRVGDCGLPLLVAVNKVDIVKPKGKLLPLLSKIQEMWHDAMIFPISAATGEGVDALLDAALAQLPEAPAMYPEDQLSTVPLRFMAAETIREKLFLNLRQELPYAVTVEIEEWHEEAVPDRPPLTRIGAAIYAAKDNHKAMIIGKAGATLKAIGTQARMELEELLGTKVFLSLFVKIRDNWTDDPAFLRTMGLGEMGSAGELEIE